MIPAHYPAHMWEFRILVYSLNNQTGRVAGESDHPSIYRSSLAVALPPMYIYGFLCILCFKYLCNGPNSVLTPTHSSRQKPGHGSTEVHFAVLQHFVLQSHLVLCFRNVRPDAVMGEP
jgi:hypothetical protein